MYFQHHTGQIRQAQLTSNGDWEGGDVTQIVAVDAKNATPIAAVAYARNDTAAVSLLRCIESKIFTNAGIVAHILYQCQQHNHGGDQ